MAGLFAVLLVLQVVGGGAAQRADQVLGLAWSELAAFLLPAAMVAAGSNLLPARFLLLARRPTAAQVGLGALAGLAGFAAASGLVGLWTRLLPPAWIRAFDLLSRFQGTPLQQAGLVAVAAGLAPVCEEIAFRGYLQSALRLRLRDGAALAVGAVLFAAMHLNPVSLPGLLLLGALFGWLALRTGSVWPGVAAHAANNAVASLIAVAVPDAAGRAEPAELLSALALLAVGLAALPALRMALTRAAPEAPAPLDAVEALDPSRPPGGFRPSALPRRYLFATAAAWLALAALLAWRAPRG